MLNKIVVMGRLTRDPELRRTQSGLSVTSFSVACDRDFKSQSGEKETDFIDIVAWRQTAEFVCKYFSKGRMAVVEGRLQIRDWQDNNGNKRRSAEIVADNVYFGDSKRDGDGGGYPQGSYAPQGGYPQRGPSYGAPEMDVRHGFYISRTRHQVRRDLSALATVLRKRMNDLGYDPYWQRFMCMNWDDIGGCSAGCTDCDSCTAFRRIQPQYCARCGGTFYERKENRFCAACRTARKKQAQRHWCRVNGMSRK